MSTPRRLLVASLILASTLPVEVAAATRKQLPSSAEPCPEALQQCETRQAFEFDEAWAMCRLFGRYGRKGRSSLVLDKRRDGTLASIGLSTDLSVGGRRLHVLVVGKADVSDGEVLSSHAAVGNADVHVYAFEKEQWRLAWSQEHFAEGGSHGNPPSVALVQVGPERFALEVSAGGTWFGNTISWSRFFLINGDRLERVGPKLTNDTGACGNIPQVCREVELKWQWVPGREAGWYDLVVEGEERRGAPLEEGAELGDEDRVLVTRHWTHTYAFQRGDYRIQRCEEPEPWPSGLQLELSATDDPEGLPVEACHASSDATHAAGGNRDP